MPTRKEVAEAKLVQLAEARNKAEKLAEKKRKQLFKACLRAHKAGLTYRTISDIVDLSEIRVAQILRSERENGQS